MPLTGQIDAQRSCRASPAFAATLAAVTYRYSHGRARAKVTTLAGLLGAALLLSGCSGGAEEPDAEPTATGTSTSGSVESSPEEPAVDPEASENLDPCSVVARKAWVTFVPRAQREAARLEPQLVDRALGLKSLIGGGGLEADDYPKYGCEVRYDGGGGRETTAIAWGWYLVDLPPQKVNKIVASAGGETHNQGSYAAVTSGDLLVSTAYGVLPPDNGFWVAADARIDSKPRLADSDSPLGTMDERLLGVLDFLAPQVDKTPILLPERCPDPTEPDITSVIGEVKQARGSDDGEAELVCLYRNQQQDVTLRLRVGSDAPETVAHLLEGSGEDGRKQDSFEGPDDTVGAAVTSPNGIAAGYLVESSRSTYAIASVEQQIPHQTPRVSRSALIRVLEAAHTIAAGTN